jgi:S-adenosylmethionine/arginine decarboxylase-like enzyme
MGRHGRVVLAESHLAIHTWPERDGATLDVYVCNYTADNTAKAEAVYKTLIKALKPVTFSSNASSAAATCRPRNASPSFAPDACELAASGAQFPCPKRSSSR